MILTEKQKKEFEKVVRPLIKWLSENETGLPHHHVVVDYKRAVLSQGGYCFTTDDYKQEADCLEAEKLGKYTGGERAVLLCAEEWAQADGAHHKAWVIDQMCRAILGDEYDAWVSKYEKEEDGDTYTWETGCAP